MSIPAPSWLLLFWCGFAAALTSEWVVAFLRALFSPAAREPATGPRLLTTPRGSIPFAILSGTLVFAPLYGLVFEWIARADASTGALLGAAHGALAGALAIASLLRRRRATPPAAGRTSLRPMLGYRARRLFTRILYGALLGFLYVVPGR